MTLQADGGVDAEERAAAGKRLRADVRRSSHAEWKPPAGRADPVAILGRIAVRTGL